MDTGSSDLWIETTQCTNCPRGNAQLNTGSSSSIQTTSNSVSFSYGQGQAQGTMATDTVSLAGFTISSQVFGTSHVPPQPTLYCMLMQEYYYRRGNPDLRQRRTQRRIRYHGPRIPIPRTNRRHTLLASPPQQQPTLKPRILSLPRS